MERYQGEEKILISIDLGTTMSPYTPHTNPCLGRRFSQVRWPTRIYFQVQYLKSGKGFLVVVVPSFRTRSRIVNRWPGQEEAAGDSKVEPTIIRGIHSLSLTTFRFRLWWPMKVVARLHLARRLLSMLEQTGYSSLSGSNSSMFIGMYGTTTSDHPTCSCSLHPDSMKVSNEPPGSHPFSSREII